MPTYDYVCVDCGKEFEFVQSMRDEPLQRCILDGCDGQVRRRIGSGAGLIFKGSGFYITDYKNGGGKAKSDGDSGSKSDKSESKPESAPATCTSNPATCGACSDTAAE